MVKDKIFSSINFTLPQALRNLPQGPMLSIFTDVTLWHRKYISVDYPVICSFLFTRQLGPVNQGKKSVVDNIGPRIQYITDFTTPHCKKHTPKNNPKKHPRKK
jgi:hypothetical protein